MATRSRKKWPVIAGFGFIVAFIAWMALSTLGNAQYHCEVCVTFEGRTVCRNGAATTREQAERIATDGACTDLTSGMTSLMQCQNGADRKVTWKQ
jgi:hypothetical protein